MTDNGFTLIEVMSVVAILSLLATLFWGPEMQARARDLKRVQADVTSEEIRRLSAAAQIFALQNNGDWPDQENDCRGSFALLPLSAVNLRSPFFAGDVASGTRLPFAIGLNEVARIGHYYLTCPENPVGTQRRSEFIIRLAFADEDEVWSGYIASQLAGANHFSTGDYPAVEVFSLLPSAIPAFQGFLPRDGSLAMTGDLDVDGHVLHDARDVMLETGQTLASVPLLHTVAKPGNQIVKPRCPAQYQPIILVTPKSIAHIAGLPITQFKVWATDLGSAWRIRSQVFGTRGDADQDNSSKVLVNVLVKCAL